MSNIQIRWLIRRDMSEVLRIESTSFEFPWDDDDFLCVLRQRNCIPMVAEVGPKILGFMIYELRKSRLHILNFAVHPQHRRQGVGLTMVERLRGKLTQQRRTELIVEVRERNLDALLFFKAMGFEAISLLRENYEDTGEDCVLMQYRLPIGANGDEA